jgi:tetratricopeptide (TPR) repeat protein
MTMRPSLRMHTGKMQTWLALPIGICLAVAASAGPFAANTDDGAVARLKRALAAEEAEDGRTSPYLLPVIEELAQAQLRDGALGEAAALRRRAVDIAIAAFGCGSPSAAAAMAVLAMLDIDRGRYLDGEPLLIAAERVLSARVDRDLPAVATVLGGLARIALSRGEAPAAEIWARRAVEIARHNPHGRSAEPLRTLGATLTARERFDEAARILAEALAIDRKYHGAAGAETARSLSTLAHLELRRGRPGEALPMIEEALAIDQGRLGANHPFIADDLHDLGLVYEALHRDAAARKAFSAAIAVLERGAGRETPRIAYAELELARLYRQAGRDAEADTAFQDARRILNKAEAEEHRRERRV